MKKISGALDTIKNISEALEANRVGTGHFDCSDEYYTEDLKLALISLLDEVVMEEKRLIHDVNWAEGYNACRAALIKKINEVKK